MSVRCSLHHGPIERHELLVLYKKIRIPSLLMMLDEKNRTLSLRQQAW
jgi:hypothetical protein